MSQAKQAAGHRAAELVEPGMTLGLGTGSTVRHFLEGLAARIEAEGLAVRGVPTSIDTAERAAELGIETVGLEDVSEIDLTVDGADEIDPAFDMIKGGGGALLREKVVARISRREVIVVGPEKRVAKLGTTFALPLEVVPFAVPVVLRELERFDAQLVVRARDGKEFRTDNGNAVVDVRFANGIDDAAGLERELLGWPGIVEVGLFIGLAHAVVVGYDDGRTELAWKD